MPLVTAAPDGGFVSSVQTTRLRFRRRRKRGGGNQRHNRHAQNACGGEQPPEQRLWTRKDHD